VITRKWTAIAAVVLAASCLAGAQAKPSSARALVEKNFAAWNAHDADKVAAVYTSDVSYEDVAFGEKAHGSAELKKMVQGFFEAVPDLKLDVVDVKTSGNYGSVEWTFSGTDKGLYKTGKKFSVRGASVFQIRGGKFSSNKDYYDSASIMRQVGVLPKQ
jgi:steroid delta-isomerase-like uncharacterized protein